MESVERFVRGKWETTKYVPALNKIIDEILDNSIDEAIRTEFKHANKIDVSISGEWVTVTDNGRGIPQDEIYDSASDEYIKRPVAAWTRVNAGTSFTEDRVSIGANGVGSSCVNFVSSEFQGETWCKGTMVKVYCTDGGLEVKVIEMPRSGSGTKVSFTPDFELFETDSLVKHDIWNLVEDRVMSLQLAFPEITFSLNGKRVQVNTLKKYSELFRNNENDSVVVAQTDTVSYFITSSEDGFRSNSFVNGVNTRQGGTYVDWMTNSLVDELTSMIKRKFKIEVTKSTIKSGLTFVLFSRNFTNPKFDSQTKERLTNTVGAVKEHYESSGAMDFVTMGRKIMASEDIIGPIVEAQLAKKLAADKRAATLAQKKLKKVKVPKHVAANGKNATCMLVEGDSAISSFLEVRNKDMLGGYPLRGVVMNTWDMKPADVLKNKELSELVSVLNLDITHPDSYKDMSYQDVAIFADPDHDGGGHICPLLIAFFYKFWPGLILDGRIKITRTPIMISTNGKNTEWFYTYNDAQAFKATSKGYSHRYIKGLASLVNDEYEKIINNPINDVVNMDDAQCFQIMFGNDPELRKEYLT
jgi:DNA topoisomerase-2